MDPAGEHRCALAGPRAPLDLAHQAQFCLTPGYAGCPRFVPPERLARAETLDRVARDAPDAAEERAPGLPIPAWLAQITGDFSPLQIAAWGVVAILALAMAGMYLTSRATRAASPAGLPAPAFVSPSPSPAVPPHTTMAPPLAASTRLSAPAAPAPPEPTATLVPGRLQAVLSPAADAVGWVSSGDPVNHFGDRNLHAGTFEGQTYHGAIQFSLASIPAGARIESSAIELVGLNAENVGEGGRWSLRLLVPDADADWTSTTFERLHAAPTLGDVRPELGPADLEARRTNVFTFDPGQLRELESRLAAGAVSFRLDGPAGTANNLFTWDTGYGGGLGRRPVLRVVFRPPPTLTPIYVTATATPANILTVAAAARTATYVATAIGTATPWPANAVTPDGTGAVAFNVIVNTSTPANPATATYAAAEATARAFLFGTPTPPSREAVTATPLPTEFVVVQTATPGNVVTAAALAVRATARAGVEGTPTPFPPNAAFRPPILVITNTPTPATAATAAWQATVRVAEAIVYGTPTRLPAWVVTATPVPLLVYLDAPTRTPMPGPTLVPSAAAILAQLRGKILFRSDRLGNDRGDVCVYEPATERIAVLSQPWVYDQARLPETLSPDGLQRVVVRDYRGDAQLWLMNTADGWLSLLTGELGGADYDPVWQPGGPLIAYVAQQDLNDEIYLVNKDTKKRTRLTTNMWEWDKHPTWSTDGRQIVFFSNRGPGRSQVWIMNADGSDQRPLWQDDWNDWDPIWVK